MDKVIPTMQEKYYKDETVNRFSVSAERGDISKLVMSIRADFVSKSIELEMVKTQGDKSLLEWIESTTSRPETITLTSFGWDGEPLVKHTFSGVCLITHTLEFSHNRCGLPHHELLMAYEKLKVNGKDAK